MARAPWNTNRNGVPLRSIFSREITFSPQIIKNLNWKILRSFIISKNGFNPKSIETFQGAKSCSRIVYTDGYLIIKDISMPNNLKIYNLNGHNRKPCLKYSISVGGEWKDFSFAIGPVLSSNKLRAHPDGFQIALYFITAKKLHFLNCYTGNFEFFLLPDGHRFSEIAIDNETHQLAISSVKTPKADCLMVFALYEYYPSLIFQQLLQIKKSVFGQSLIGAEINQGLILTLHKANKVKVYCLASVCQNQDCVPPLLLEIVSFNHVMAIGANIPYYLVKATHFNSFLVQNLDDGISLSSINGKQDFFDPYLGFHPDASPRLIFTDNDKLQIFNIITKDEKPSLVPGLIHSLSSSVAEVDGLKDQASSTTTVTASGRTVKKPVYASVYPTSDDDETVHLAWDYEDDLEILGVLYARQIDGRQPHLQLTLDLIDSPSGKRLKRVELDPKIRISSFDSTEIFLRLDADQCLISISRSNRVTIILFRFVSSSSS